MSDTSRRRWFTFRLRTFLFAVTVLAIWLGWWSNSARQQRIGVAAFRQALLDTGRGESEWPCHYDYSIVPLGNANTGSGPFDDVGIEIDYRAVPAEPEWILNRFGVDFFHNVVAVDVPAGLDADSMLINVGRFRRLQHLEIERGPSEYAPGNGGIACLANLKQLKSLAIKDCSALTDDALQVIGGLSELEILRLWGGRFTDGGLAHLKGLSRLKRLTIGDYLSEDPDIPITDAGLANIADLVNLEQLYIDSPHVTSEGLKHLVKLQKLDWLTLGSPQITDDGLRYLAELSSLSWIEFIGTGIDGSAFKHLRGHQKLTRLNLNSTRLNDEGLAEIARLPALEWLSVMDTQVTAAGLEQLKACQHLKTLTIWKVPGDINHLKAVLAPCKVIGP